MAFEKASDALKSIIDRYGKSVFGEPNKCASLFADFMPGADLERRLIKTACESGVYLACISSSEDERQNCATLSIHKLITTYGINPSLAASTMSWLCEAMSYHVVCNSPSESAGMPEESPVEINPGKLEPLLQRALLAIEDGEWENANAYCERALDDNPTNAQAYLLKLMSERKAHSLEELLLSSEPLSESKLYSKIERFADAELLKSMQQIDATILTRKEEARCSVVYQEALHLFETAASPEEIELARKRFLSIKDFRDSSDYADRCRSEWKNRQQKAETDLKILRTLDDGPNTIHQDETVLASIEAEVSALEEARKQLAQGIAQLPELETVLSHITQTLEQKRKERSSLGVFAGKQKKAVSIEIQGLEGQLSETNARIKSIHALMDKHGGETQLSQKIDKKRSEMEAATKRLEEDRDTLAREAENHTVIQKRILSQQNLQILSRTPGAVEYLSNYREAIEFYAKDPEALPVLLKSDNAQRIIRGDDRLIRLLPLPYQIRFTDYFELGRYAQSGELASPIRWKILNRWGNCALAISERCIAYLQMKDIAFLYTWESCALRKWLNYTFFEEAFSNDERENILTATIPNPPQLFMNEGYNTNDSVFLLSINEVSTYFASDSDRKAYPTMNVFRSCKYCSGPDAPISWWLRTPGENHGTLGAAYVQSGGFINDSGDNADTENGVRPAIVVKLS